MKVLATPPDVLDLVVNYLTPLLISRGEDVTVGDELPASWSALPISKGGSKPHILVAHDGTPNATYPIVAAASVRVTAFCGKTAQRRAFHLSTLCQGLLLARTAGGGMGSIQFLSGALPAKDPDTNAAMSFVAVRVNLLYTVLV